MDGQGFGDQFRGLFWALRLAAAHGREFRVDLHIDKQNRLEHLFEPALIDWRVGNETQPANYTFNDMRISTGAGIHGVWNDLPSFNNSESTSPDSFIFVNTSMSSGHMHCLWHALFKPTPYLQASIDREYSHFANSANLGADGLFTAIHLRLGNLEGERGAVDRGGAPLEMFIRVLEAAEAHQLPIFFATSDSDVRRAIRKGWLTNVTGPRFEHAVHSSITDANHLETFTE